MPGLYVPLGVNYADDARIVEAGAMAELLFVRSLAFAKRDQRNGHIAASQLQIVAARIPRVRHQVDQLLEVGLWEEEAGGLFHIRAWGNWNPLTDSTVTKKSAAGTFGNHVRWHRPPDGEPSAECEHCRKERLAP